MNTREFFSVLLEDEDGLFPKREALCLVGIGAARLENPQCQQLSLFSLPSTTEVQEAETCAATEAAETEKRAAVVAAQVEKHRKLGEMQATISTRYGDKALLHGGALLSAERNKVSDTQVKSKQQRAEIKEP